MITERETELRALLVRAAEQEARRKAAKERGETQARWAAERELQRLWRRHGELERAAARPDRCGG